MAFSTGTINSATPAKDLAAAVAAQLTAGGYTLVETYATPTAATWYQVIYGGGQFIAAVNGVATAITSPDGQTWTQRALPLSQAWTTVAYGAGLYVLMAGGSATYLTSPDGITWTQRTLPVAGAWNRNLVYGGGQFVCFNANAAYTSPDGINWTARTLPANATWSAAAYGGGTFVAIGSATGTAVTSTDGITWTLRSGPSAVTYPGLTYGNGLFVALANGNAVAFTSPDGITWTSRSLPVTSSWQSVAYGAGLFVAVSNGGVNYTATSPDGITWTQRTSALPSTATWFTVAYGGGQFAALATTSTTGASSPDGLTWTQRTMTGTANTAAADVWKSPAAGNSFGSDWYLILRRASDTGVLLYYQVAETYDPVTHKASNVGGTSQSVAPTATTYTNPAGAVLADQTYGTSAYLNTVTAGVAFTYWASATPDRFILTIKTSTSETGGFYAGLYEDLLPAGVTQFPLVCAKFPTDLSTTGQLGVGNSGSASGGFTREPGTSAINGYNFTAAISNGMIPSLGVQVQQNWTPMPGAGALYGNVGTLSRVMLGTVRAANHWDAVRGLLYGCLASGVTSLAGDTITSGGKTYVRVTGPTTTYGFFVDQAL